MEASINQSQHLDRYPADNHKKCEHNPHFEETLTSLPAASKFGRYYFYERIINGCATIHLGPISELLLTSARKISLVAVRRT